MTEPCPQTKQNWIHIFENSMQKACKRKASDSFLIWALSWGQVDDVGQILLSVTLVWISVVLLWIYTDVAEKKTCPVSFPSSVTILLNLGLHLRSAASYKLPYFTTMPAGISLLICQCLAQKISRQLQRYFQLSEKKKKEEEKAAQELPRLFWVQSFG